MPFFFFVNTHKVVHIFASYDWCPRFYYFHTFKQMYKLI